MNAQLKELKQLIHAHLNECDNILTPTICEMKETEKGKKELEQRILEVIIKRGLTVGQAVNEIEREYNPNLIND